MGKEPARKKIPQTPSCILYLAAASALMGAIGMGAVLGWTAPAFDSMSKNQSVPRLMTNSSQDKLAKSWIGSSATLGALVGALISGPVSQSFGRRTALISAGVPYTIGWSMLAFANSIAIIITGRVIVGFSAGLVSGTAPTYVVEISIIRIRGFLGSGFQVCNTTGILLVYITGAFLNWNALAGVAAIPPLIMTIFMFFMPETPSWLLAHNRRDDAEESLKRLRGPGSDTKQEMAQLEEQAKLLDRQSFSMSLYMERLHLHPLLLAMGIMFFQQFSGINAVRFYTTDIFKEAGSHIEPKYATIIVGVAQTMTTIFASLLVDKLGRKMLLTASGVLHVLSAASLGLYYYCIGDHEGGGADSYGWVPLASLVVFIVGHSVGWGPVPWLLTAEITPTLSRSATSAIVTGFYWTCAFTVTQKFETLKNAITKHGTFFLFTSFSLVSIVYVLIALPETRGRTSKEIMEYFGGPKAASGGGKNGQSGKK